DLREQGIESPEFQRVLAEDLEPAGGRVGTDADVAGRVDGQVGGAVVGEETQLVIAARAEPAAAGRTTDKRGEADRAVGMFQAVGFTGGARRERAAGRCGADADVAAEIVGVRTVETEHAVPA